MKFAEHLSTHITPEWRTQYINYEEMKVMLYSAIGTQQSTVRSLSELESAPCLNDAFDEEMVNNKRAFETEFFSYCEKELTKIDNFFAEKLAESMRKFNNLNYELTVCLTKEKQRIQSSFSSRKYMNAQKENETEKLNGKSEKMFRFGIGTPLVVAAATAAARATATAASRQMKHREGRMQHRKMHDMKLAFSEFYLSLVLIQNYQNLNFTGFRKILKKHDKLLCTNEGANWRISHVDCSNFFTNKEVERLITETENVFTEKLESGDRGRAMKRLRVPPLNARQSPVTTFRVGLFLGAFLVLLASVIISGIYKYTNDNTDSIEWNIVLKLYRGPLFLIIFLFFIGGNVYGWRTSGVNHVLIFELDPRDHLSEQHIIEMAAFFSVLWSISLLGYLFSDELSIPANAHPLILITIMLIYLFNPTRTLRYSARLWLLRVLGRVFTAPLRRVTFADFWIADQLNSLVPLLLDIQFIVCYYLSLIGLWSSGEKDLLIRTLVACLPAWFRFAQCLKRYKDDNRGVFPHLINAGKYSTTFFVVIFSTLTQYTNRHYDNSIKNPFFILWIMAMLLSSTYTYLWDIKMDWGLFEWQKRADVTTQTGQNGHSESEKDNSDTKEYPFLREEIVYSSQYYYYFAIIEDLILRFGWTLSVSLVEIGVIRPDLMVSFLAPLELFRRFVWNFFRLENEHLNNCGEFRAVRDISVMPMKFKDKTSKFLNPSNGVVYRKNKLNVPDSAVIEMRDSRQMRKRTSSLSSLPSRKSEIQSLLEDDDTNKSDHQIIEL